MGDAADDMYDHAMRESEKVLCAKHQHYYHPEHGCELCEDGLPPVKSSKRKFKTKVYIKSSYYHLPLKS